MFELKTKKHTQQQQQQNNYENKSLKNKLIQLFANISFQYETVFKKKKTKNSSIIYLLAAFQNKLKEK